MSILLRQPKIQVAIALVLIYITAFIHYPTFTTLTVLILSVGLMALFDLLLCYIKNNLFFFPSAAIVTGLILTLIIDPSVPWYYITLIAALSMTIKNLVRISNRHIFNPIAIGLFLAAILLDRHLVAWWGVSFQNINQLTIRNILFFLILLLPGLVSAYRLRKYYSIITFILTTILISQIFYTGFSLQGIVGTLLTPSFIFFALVMLPEPMTSPVRHKMQILYGMVVAIASFALSIPRLDIPVDPLVFGLLVGNLVFFKMR